MLADRLRGGWRPSSMEDVLAFLQVDLFQSPDRLFTEGIGLARAAALLDGLDRPQDDVAVVHVAGTAGKGTVASGIAAVANRRGRRVGLHVSPHVYDLRERFTVDGSYAAPDQVVAALEAVLPAIGQVASGPHGPPTFFEVTLAMALVHFRAQACDLVVLETGIGGRFDATNLVSRQDKLGVITRIGLDHEAVLGSTLAAIADQKAGILPPGGRAVVLHHGVPEVDDTVAAVAADRSCRLWWVRTEEALGHRAVGRPAPGAARLAAHQREDLALVAAAAELVGSARMTGDEEAGDLGWGAPGSGDTSAGELRPDVLDEVAGVLAGLALPGRFERVRTPEGGTVVLDGAHNPIKLAALLDRLSLDRLAPDPAGSAPARGPATVVFGCRRDKKAGEMLALLGPLVAAGWGEPGGALELVEFPIVAGDVSADRSMDPSELAALAARAGIRPDVTRVTTVADAAAGGRRATALTLVVGSFHLLAALRPHLGVDPWPGGLAGPEA